MTDKTNGYQLYRLPRTNHQQESDIMFEGKVVAFVSSDPEELGDRWTELTLYETRGGKFVAQSVGKTVYPNERNFESCEVFSTLPEVRPFFKVKGKVTWLSKQMFDEISRTYPEFDDALRVG